MIVSLFPFVDGEFLDLPSLYLIPRSPGEREPDAFGRYPLGGAHPEAPSCAAHTPFCSRMVLKYYGSTHIVPDTLRGGGGGRRARHLFKRGQGQGHFCSACHFLARPGRQRGSLGGWGGAHSGPTRIELLPFALCFPGSTWAGGHRGGPGRVNMRWNDFMSAQTRQEARRSTLRTYTTLDRLLGPEDSLWAAGRGEC